MRWRDLVWRLMHGPLHRTVAQIDEMTMGELELALDDDTEKRRGPEGVTAMSPMEMAAFAERRRSMTAREKLDEARRR